MLFLCGIGRKLGLAGTGVHGRYEEAVGGKGHVLPCERQGMRGRVGAG